MSDLVAGLPLPARFAIVALAAYLIGAIPWALIIGKSIYGIDPRTAGSGNLGATNVGRLMGWKAALGSGTLDALKGFVSVWIAIWLVPPASSPEHITAWAEVVAAFCAILGHSYSPYVAFKGGKGIATAAGALLVMNPITVPILLAVFAFVLWLTSMVSAGSVTIAALYPVLILAIPQYRDEPAFIFFSFVAAALVIWRHHTNISRIIKGEERRITWGRHARRAAVVPADNSDSGE